MGEAFIVLSYKITSIEQILESGDLLRISVRLLIDMEILLLNVHFHRLFESLELLFTQTHKFLLEELSQKLCDSLTAEFRC